jgi:hypothetical protein
MCANFKLIVICALIALTTVSNQSLNRKKSIRISNVRSCWCAWDISSVQSYHPNQIKIMSQKQMQESQTAQISSQEKVGDFKIGVSSVNNNYLLLKKNAWLCTKLSLRRRGRTFSIADTSLWDAAVPGHAHICLSGRGRESSSRKESGQ